MSRYHSDSMAKPTEGPASTLSVPSDGQRMNSPESLEKCLGEKKVEEVGQISLASRENS